MGNILINTRVLRDPFLVGIPLIIVECRMQDIFILEFLKTTHATSVPRGSYQVVFLGPVYFEESICRLASSSRS